MSASNDDAITFSGEPLEFAPWAGHPEASPTAAPARPVPEATASSVGASSNGASSIGASSIGDTARPGGLMTPDLVREFRKQVVAAHRAALEAQTALQQRALSLLDASAGQAQPGQVAGSPAADGNGHHGLVRSAAVGRRADGGSVPERGPGRFDMEYPVPPETRRGVDGQVALADVVEALHGDRVLAAVADGTGYRLREATIVFRDDLPLEGATLRNEVEVSGATGDGISFTARCRVGDRPVAELIAGQAGSATGPSSVAGVPTGHDDAAAARSPLVGLTRFKPLARTGKRRLGAADIELLAAGRIRDVFGDAHHHQAGCPSLRLPGEQIRVLDGVLDIDRMGGRSGLGALVTTGHLTGRVPAGPVSVESLIVDGAFQSLEIYLLYLGMHLVLPDTRFQPVQDQETRIQLHGEIPAAPATIRYEVDVAGLAMVPRPHVIADVVVHAGDRPIMTIRGLGVQIKEKPGVAYRPAAGGKVETFFGRTNSRGERALANEFHMAHAAKGDLSVAMGPEFEIYRDVRAPHIPNGDFLFVDRVMAWSGERGQLKPGATMVTEYDSPAESWYYQDNGHPVMPNCVLMETSLQSAILLGYYLGATLPHPGTEFSIRNLDGHATVSADIDLRETTIRQTSRLLSHSSVSGVVLQSFSYQLEADGKPFYSGESGFGYFSKEALATQVGLDSGKYVAPWLEEAGRGQRARRIDLRDKVDPLTKGDGLRLGSRQLRLVDWVDFVPEGGHHSAGYLRGYRHIDPREWYFSCHFHRDPVMPGSLGVEAILQAMQLYVMETGLAAGLERPRFTLPAGVEMRWKYRGQVLRSDRSVEFDVHIKEIRHEPGRVVVIGDASLWKPGLRIYELNNIAVAVAGDS